MNTTTFSQQFYTNHSDVKHVFIQSSALVKAEILQSELIDFAFKVELLEAFLEDNYYYELIPVFELINDLPLVVKLSHEVYYDKYIITRFGVHIDDDKFKDFHILLDNITIDNITMINQIKQFEFDLSKDEYNQMLFNSVMKLENKAIIIIINGMGRNSLNFFCSKKPSLITNASNFRNLEGRNFYRFIVNTLSEKNRIYPYYIEDIRIVKSLVKHHFDDLKLSLLEWTSAQQREFIFFLIKNREAALAKQIYTIVPENMQIEINKSGFAFYNQRFNPNLLNLDELKSNIYRCHDEQLLINAIVKLDKSKIIELFEEGLYNITALQAEKILSYSFSILEINQICESNLEFARNVIVSITNPETIKVFSNSNWFWIALSGLYLRSILKVIPLLTPEKVINNLLHFNQVVVVDLFDYYYQINAETGYEVFEKCSDSYKLNIILNKKGLINKFIDRYGFDYIINLADYSFVRSRLLEKLPIDLAMKMVEKLGLTIDSYELKSMHQGRYNALIRRINALNANSF